MKKKKNVTINDLENLIPIQTIPLNIVVPRRILDNDIDSYYYNDSIPMIKCKCGSLIMEKGFFRHTKTRKHHMWKLNSH